MKQQTFPIEQIELDARCQARAAIHHDAVDDYAEVLRAGGELPAIDVFLVVGVPYVIDGFHRAAAHVKAGITFVLCRIVGAGTIDQAVWAAARANATNGLRRTAEDKRRAVRLALESPIGQEQSSRAIAEYVGVSDFLVREVRAEVEAAAQVRDLAPVESSPKTRTGKDGKSHPAARPQVRDLAPAAETPEPTRDVSSDDTSTESRVELDEETSVLPAWARTLEVLAKQIAGLRIGARATVKDTTVHAQSLERALKDAESAVDGAVPVICPFCKGARCARCKSRGWVTRNDASQLKATAKVLGREVTP